MELLTRPTVSLDWHLDFSPLTKWPPCLPVICAQEGNRTVVLGGFERRSEENVAILVVEGSASENIFQIWQAAALLPLENLRLRKLLNEPVYEDHLLDWPLSLQHFLDQKQLPLKSLRPLSHLGEWKTEVSEQLQSTSPTSSQIREILDLLCDLKMDHKSWGEVAPPKGGDGAVWLQHLKAIRFPKTLSADDRAKNQLQNLPWPRGTQVRWERQGDQAGIVFQTRIHSPQEWKKLKEKLVQMDIGDSFWN